MKSTAALIAALCVALTTVTPAGAQTAAKPEAKKPAEAAQPKWPEYRGKSFKVNYPPTYKPQTLEAKNPKESDAATFTSPDGAMQLYIFSPQWDGTPPGIALDAAKETETAKKSEPGKSSGVAGTFTWVTISAKDKSYTRTYQSFKAKDEPIHWVIGMKYKDDAALAKYRADYARFKGSLAQYAD